MVREELLGMIEERAKAIDLDDEWDAHGMVTDFERATCGSEAETQALVALAAWAVATYLETHPRG